jgi:hypothetical protein
MESGNIIYLILIARRESGDGPQDAFRCLGAYTYAQAATSLTSVVHVHIKRLELRGQILRVTANHHHLHHFRGLLTFSFASKGIRRIVQVAIKIILHKIGLASVRNTFCLRMAMGEASACLCGEVEVERVGQMHVPHSPVSHVVLVFFWELRLGFLSVKARRKGILPKHK